MGWIGKLIGIYTLLWRRQWHPTSVLLPGKSHGQRSLVGCSPRGRPSGFTFTFHFHALEEEMATHSSVLAWRIPGTGEPGGLPSLGLQSWTQLKWLSSSSSSLLCLLYKYPDLCFFQQFCTHRTLTWLYWKSKNCDVGNHMIIIIFFSNFKCFILYWGIAN